MRKTLLIISTLLATALTASAQEETTVRTYTDDLVVTIDGSSTEPMETTVQVEMLDDNKINFVLSNFVLVSEGEEAPVGNIEVEGIDLVDEDGYQTFAYQGSIKISVGDLEGVDFWLGPMLGDVPLDLKGKMTEDKIYLTIDIDLQLLGQVIGVSFGSDFEAEGGETEGGEEGDEEGGETEGETTPEAVSTADYTANLVVTINGSEAEPVETTVEVQTLSDGTANLSLPNLSLMGMNIGTINAEGIQLEEAEASDETAEYKGKYTSMAFQGTASVTGGLGAMLLRNGVEIDLQGKMTDDDLYLTLSMDVSLSGVDMEVAVEFGSDFTSAVTAVRADAQPASSAVYDLSGRRAGNASKGIFIVNGKKVLRK